MEKDLQITNFNECKEAFSYDVSCDFILTAMAAHLLGCNTESNNANIADVEDLAKDLEPLFDKWVW